MSDLLSLLGKSHIRQRVAKRFIKTKPTSLYISKIHSSTKGMVHASEGIAAEFQKFYMALYNLPCCAATTMMAGLEQTLEQYLIDTALPSLSQEAIDTLTLQFSPNEIEYAIKALPAGKSPGPDGYTALFYKRYVSNLMLILLKVFNRVSGSVPFSQ